MSDPVEARELADEIAAHVARTDWVTCGELLTRFGNGLRGEWAMELEPKLLTWVGISRLLIDAMTLLRDERPLRVVLWPINPLLDLADASPLCTLPRAKRRPPGGYKKDHFVHVGLRPVAKLREDERRMAGIDIRNASNVSPRES